VIVVGLTGSIAMGKSTVAQMFVAAGWPVFDADAAVHAFYGAEGAGVVDAAFPGVTVDGVVDRKLLSAKVLGDNEAIHKLEAIVHPAVGIARQTFLAKAYDDRRRGVVLDIPLLFETGGEKRCDVVVVVSASSESQRQRALSRPGLDAKRFDALLARQVPDAVKRRKAHYVVDTEMTMQDSARQVGDLVRAIVGLPGGYRGSNG
jgi:dephospho-CoA kinase